MELFVSWSGLASKAAARAIKDFLLTTFANRLNIWFSETEIVKGARWNHELSAALERCQLGIVCVTRSNRNSPWLMFEAGAIAKAVSHSRVCPILLGFTVAEMDGPLTQFQLTQVNKHDFSLLVHQINSIMPVPISSKGLKTMVETGWPRLKRRLAKVAAITEPSSTGAVEAELLRVLRQMTTYEDFSSLLKPTPFRKLRSGKRRRLERATL